MKRLVWVLFLPLGLTAQNSQVPSMPWPESNGESIFTPASLPASIDEASFQQNAEKYLTFSLSDLQSKSTAIKLKDQNKSQVARHLSYTQVYKNIPVYGSDIKINVGNDDRIFSVFYKTANTSSWSTVEFPQPDADRIVTLTKGNYNYVSEPVWYTDGISQTPAWKIEFASDMMHEEVVVDTRYNVLYKKDKKRYLDPDTSVKAYIYLPDPLTKAKVPYGAPYADNGDADNAALSAARTEVEFRVSLSNDSFMLTGPYARLVELSPPSSSFTFSKKPSFYFTRSEQGFEDVNVYYHISQFQAYVQSLGFDKLGNEPLRFDAHAKNGADQSSFDFFNNNIMLLFGEGGIDDAEDADVIIHEYCHFLSYRAVGDNNYGSERVALEEGLCDYFACSYSKAISTYNWEKLYNWDGNETWKGRSCVSSKVYPRDLIHKPHTDGELWAGTVMEIWDKLGRETTDRLMLNALYFLSRNMKMEDLARSFLQSDSILNGGANSNDIINAFQRHGMLTSFSSVPENEIHTPLYVVNTKFTDGELMVQLSEPASGKLKLVDMQGKELVSGDFKSLSVIQLQAPNIAAGVYLLKIQANDLNQTLKLMKK